jgi:hypothetical protein
MEGIEQQEEFNFELRNSGIGGIKRKDAKMLSSDEDPDEGPSECLAKVQTG